MLQMFVRQDFINQVERALESPLNRSFIFEELSVGDLIPLEHNPERPLGIPERLNHSKWEKIFKAVDSLFLKACFDLPLMKNEVFGNRVFDADSLTRAGLKEYERFLLARISCATLGKLSFIDEETAENIELHFTKFVRGGQLQEEEVIFQAWQICAKKIALLGEAICSDSTEERCMELKLIQTASSSYSPVSIKSFKGLGTLLLQAVVETSYARNYRGKVKVLASDRAVPFYFKRGFRGNYSAEINSHLHESIKKELSQAQSENRPVDMAAHFDSQQKEHKSGWFSSIDEFGVEMVLDPDERSWQERIRKSTLHFN